jgi:hypothetical protein
LFFSLFQYLKNEVSAMEKLKPRSKSEQAKAISSAEAAENARRERREDKIMADCDEDDDEEDLFAAPSDDDE